MKALIILLMLVCGAFGGRLDAQQTRREIIHPSRARTENRLALVIGNGDYRAVSRLNNATKDARDMAQAFRELGFEVIAGENLSAEAMKRTILEFGAKLAAKKGVGVFYYAGHGVQLNGRNYLIPVEVDALREQTVEFDAVDVNRVLAEMDAAANGLNMVILDACRNNPFTRGWRGGSEGLASINAPTGTLIAYATAPGDVASDGAGENGLYTAALLKWMREPDLKIEEMFKKVRVEVVKSSRNQQVPWESSSLQGDFYFNPQAIKQAVAAAVKNQTTSVAATADDLKVAVKPVLGARPKYKGTLRTFAFETPYLRDGGANLVTQKKEVSYFVENLGNASELEMIEIRGGSFVMGSSPDEARKAWQTAQTEQTARYGKSNYQPAPLAFDQYAAETPARNVAVKPFFMSKYEITQAQWKAVMGDLPEFVKKRSFAAEKNADFPIFGVTWAEAREFCRKLSQKTGKKYRLPSEAEWEYAARAGSDAAYAFGAAIDQSLANYGYASVYEYFDLSVAKFYPNAFGLYQMHGNVAEICEDGWHPNHQNAPANQAARAVGASVGQHVIRGGNILSIAADCRSAARKSFADEDRSVLIGFRVVGEIE